MEKPKHSRTESFKRKSSTVDKRSLRAHRRSIEWKQLRDQTVSQNRPNMNGLSPLQEVNPSTQAKKSEKVTNRKEMLMKWKAEKELKKKIESKENVKNKPFKVSKVNEAQLRSFRGATEEKKGKTTTAKANPLPHKPVAAASSNKQTRGGGVPFISKIEPEKRSTRSQKTSAQVSKKTTVSAQEKKAAVKTAPEPKKMDPVPAARTRVTRGASARLEPSTGSKTRTAAKAMPDSEVKVTKRMQSSATSAHLARARVNPTAASTKPVKAAPKVANKPETDCKRKPVLRDPKTPIDGVTVQRGDRLASSGDEHSFAPMDFKFQAPSHLKEYFPKFTPLSPNSAEKFYMPSAVFSPPGESRRCSTPKYSVTKNPVINSPQASVIQEVTSASGSDTDSDNQTKPSKRDPALAAPPPVMSLHGKLLQDGSQSTRGPDSDSVGHEDTTNSANSTQPFKVKSVSFDLEQDKDEKSLKAQTRTVDKTTVANSQDDKGAEQPKETESATTSEHGSAAEADPMQVDQPGSAVADMPQECKKRSESVPEELLAGVVDKGINKQDDAIFKTPEPVTLRGQRSRTRSLGLMLSSSRKNKTPRNNRTSLILRHLSPEEGVEVLRNSPMVELTRRSPKLVTPISLPSFDDLDDEVLAGQSVTGNGELSQVKDCKQRSESVPEELLSCVANKENKHDDAIFKTPEPVTLRGERSRTRSLGLTLSRKKKTPKNNRTSLILRHLSPEEGVEVLRNSPMVELTRRSPKVADPSASGLAPIALPNFDDITEDINEPSCGKTEELMQDIQEEKESQNPTETIVDQGDDSQERSGTIASQGGDSQEQAGTITSQGGYSQDQAGTMASQCDSQGRHDVPYFRHLLVSETEKLDSLCNKWQQMSSDSEGLSEQVCGQIRTAIGKAQLLIAQRFKQFSGLVDACEFKTGEKETTCEDLQGFWDMVYFQVEDVHGYFTTLDRLQANGWKEEKPEPVARKVVKKKAPIKKTNKAGGKSKFAEFRARLKKQTEQPQDNSTEGEQKTFEAGFFKVSSPVRSPLPHCEVGSPGLHKARVRRSVCTGSPLLKAALGRAARSIEPSPLASAATTPESKADSAMEVETRVTRAEVGAGSPRRRNSIKPAEPQREKSEQRANVSQTVSDERVSCDVTGLADEKHDVPYFRNLLASETEKLKELCATWERVSEETPDLPENASGQVRTSVGKAQLLIAQRFKQFAGLVDACEFKTGEKETTCEDLQGFWDMVYFQVEDVHSLFANLATLKENGWEDHTAEVTNVVKKKIVKKPKTKIAGKSNFAKFRETLKKQQCQESEASDEVKTFEAGFFKISSPVRKPAVGAEAASQSPGRKSCSYTPSSGHLLKGILERNAKSRGPSPLIKSPPTASAKRKASTEEPPTDDGHVPNKVQILEETASCDAQDKAQTSNLFTPNRGGSERRRTRRSILLQSTTDSVSKAESCDGLSRLLTASKPADSPTTEVMDSETLIDIKQSGSLFTPDQSANRSLRRSTRRSVCQVSQDAEAQSLAKLLLPTASSASGDGDASMEVESVKSPVEDVEMAARMKCDLLAQFNNSVTSAKARDDVTPRRRSSILPGRSTPSQNRRLSSLKLSERAARRPSTPFKKELPRRRSSTRRSTGPALVAGSTEDTGSSESESPATRLARLTVEATPRQQPRRRSMRNRRISGFTPPEVANSPSSKLASVKEDDDLIAFSPAEDSSATDTPKQRRRSTRNSRRISGFTPPQRTASPRAVLASVREDDDLIAFSPLSSNPESEKTERRSRRFSRKSIL